MWLIDCQLCQYVARSNMSVSLIRAPCVRPLSAVQTAGHNALRGSGPGQKHAFDDALALVGCPDGYVPKPIVVPLPPFVVAGTNALHSPLSLQPIVVFPSALVQP